MFPKDLLFFVVYVYFCLWNIFICIDIVEKLYQRLPISIISVFVNTECIGNFVQKLQLLELQFKPQ